MAVWAVDGGMVSAAMARAALYNSMGYTEGIIRGGDYKVTQLPTAGAGVRISPGSGVLLNKYRGADGGGQSYGTLRESAVDLVVPNPGASSATRYIINRVTDHNYPGVQTPPDPLTHVYDDFAVVSSIPTTYPNIVLAKIVSPAGSTSVTNAMITDMRKVARPNSASEDISYGVVISDGQDKLTSTAAYPTGQYFPRVGGSGGTAVHKIDIPIWATHMYIRAEALAVAMDATAGNGFFWVTYDSVVQNNPAYWTQAFKWASTTSAGRQNWVAADTVAVPAAYRGQTINFAMRANRLSSTNDIWTDNQSGLTLNVKFLERAV